MVLLTVSDRAARDGPLFAPVSHTKATDKQALSSGCGATHSSVVLCGAPYQRQEGKQNKPFSQEPSCLSWVTSPSREPVSLLSIITPVYLTSFICSLFNNCIIIII